MIIEAGVSKNGSCAFTVPENMKVYSKKSKPSPVLYKKDKVIIRPVKGLLFEINSRFYVLNHIMRRAVKKYVGIEISIPEIQKNKGFEYQLEITPYNNPNIKEYEIVNNLPVYLRKTPRREC